MDIIPVSQYLKHKRTERTATTTLGAIKNICSYLNPDNPPKTIDDVDRQASAFIALDNAEQYRLLKDYALWLTQSSGYAPNTISLTISLIYGYMEWNECKPTARQIKLIKSTVPRPVTIHQDKPITKDILTTIIAHADPLMRAIILIQASSGMRRIEVTYLRRSDLHTDTNPRYFLISRERMKAGRPHKYRISTEAYSALTEWLKIRDDAETLAITRTSKSLGKVAISQPERIFPYNESSISRKWEKIIEKAELAEIDPNTKRLTLTPHSLRKWCESTLKRHIDKEVAEAIIGHDQGLSSAYRRYTDEDIDQEYLKAEPHLTILAPEDYADMHGRTAEALNEQAKGIAYLTSQLADMEERQKKTETALGLYMRLMGRSEKNEKKDTLK